MYGIPYHVHAPKVPLVCVCVCVRERERERERDLQRIPQRKERPASKTQTESREHFRKTNFMKYWLDNAPYVKEMKCNTMKGHRGISVQNWE